MRQINWNAIYGFWLVAEHGSFAAAAKQLPYGSVQALHKRVRQLESDENLNLKLFRSRGVKGVQLTEAGRRLHELVDPLFKPFELFAAELRGEDAGRLVVALSSYAEYHYIPGVLNTFHQRFPKVTVKLQACEPLEAINSIERSLADVGFCSPWHTPHLVTVRARAPIPLEILAPRSARLGSEPLTWPQILDAPFVLLDRSSVIRQVFDDFLRRKNLLAKLRVAAEVNKFELAVDAVAAGFGVAIVPVGPRPIRGLRGVRRLKPPPGLAEVDIAVLCREDLYMPRYMKAFVEIAANAIGG